MNCLQRLQGKCLCITCKSKEKTTYPRSLWISGRCCSSFPVCPFFPQLSDQRELSGFFLPENTSRDIPFPVLLEPPLEAAGERSECCRGGEMAGDCKMWGSCLHESASWMQSPCMLHWGGDEGMALLWLSLCWRWGGRERLELRWGMKICFGETC